MSNRLHTTTVTLIEQDDGTVKLVTSSEWNNEEANPRKMLGEDTDFALAVAGIGGGIIQGVKASIVVGRLPSESLDQHVDALVSGATNGE